MQMYLTQKHADTGIHPYCNVVKLTEQKKSLTITNALIVLRKSNKEPLWVENIKLSTQD